MSRKGRHLFTSESVTEGHPDKIADQISDAILDKVLEQEPHGRVACETLVTTGLVIIAGEITTKGYVDFPAVAREVLQLEKITADHRPEERIQIEEDAWKLERAQCALRPHHSTTPRSDERSALRAH